MNNLRVKYTRHPQTEEFQILEETEKQDSRTPSKNKKGREQYHYYPFGLKHHGYNQEHFTIGFDRHGTDIDLIAITRDAEDTYRYKFGGKEYQNEFDVNIYDFGARNYDPALGRWMNIDPLAEMMRRHSPYNYAFNNPVFFMDPDGMSPLASMAAMQTGAVEFYDFTGSSSGFDVRTYDKKTNETLGFVSVSNKQGVDIHPDGSVTANNLQTRADSSGNLGSSTMSLNGGGCPDGDCDNKDQTGNVGTGISSTAKGIEINSQNHSETYNSKYGTKNLSKDGVTKQIRNNMKSIAKGAKRGGGLTTLTFGAHDISQGVKQDGNQWGYNTNLAIGRTIGGGIGSYSLGKLGMKLGTILGGGPGVGTVAGGVVGTGTGSYFGSMFGEFIVKSIYGSK